MRRLLIMLTSLLCLVAMAVAAGCADTSQAREPATPEEMAITLFGQAREGTQEPGVYEAVVDETGLFTVKCRCALSDRDAVAATRTRVLDLFRRAFKFDQVQSVEVQVDFPFRDGSGNLIIEPGLTARMTRETASQLGWENVGVGDLPEICDEWLLDERLDG